MRASAASPRFVGTVHLLPLPGSARADTLDLGPTLERARRDAVAYAEGGADAIIVENFGDAPFAKERVGPHVIAAMTRAVLALAAEVALPIGVNILRNDVQGAIAVAAIAGGSFVRANVYVGAAVTDQGIIEGRADEVQTFRKLLGTEVEVWADVDVKHAAPLAPRPIADLAADAIERGLASAVIVTGRGTGAAPSPADLEAVRRAVPNGRVYVGSGVTPANAAAVLRWADGCIVGTAAKVGSVVTNPVDVDRVRALADAIRR